MTLLEKIQNGDYLTKLAWRNSGDAYRADQRSLELKFRADLEAEFKMDRFKQPIRDMVFERAWADGHAYGFSSVLDSYESLMELVEVMEVNLKG